MAGRKEYTWEAYTTRPIYLVGQHLLLLAALLYFAWCDYDAVLKGVHSADRGARLEAWGSLFLSIICLAVVGKRLTELLRNYHRSSPTIGVTIDDDKLTLLDEKREATEFPWYALEDVLVLPRNHRGTGMVFLVAGDHSGFIPEDIKDPEDLLAEILRRSELTLRQEEPSFRRYTRTARAPE